MLPRNFKALGNGKQFLPELRLPALPKPDGRHLTTMSYCITAIISFKFFGESRQDLRFLAWPNSVTKLIFIISLSNRALIKRYLLRCSNIALRSACSLPTLVRMRHSCSSPFRSATWFPRLPPGPSPPGSGQPALKQGTGARCSCVPLSTYKVSARNSFIDACEAIASRLSNRTNTKHLFFGSVYESFVRPGLHNGWTAWSQSQICVFAKDTRTHCQLGSATAAPLLGFATLVRGLNFVQLFAQHQLVCCSERERTRRGIQPATTSSTGLQQNFCCP